MIRENGYTFEVEELALFEDTELLLASLEGIEDIDTLRDTAIYVNSLYTEHMLDYHSYLNSLNVIRGIKARITNV